MRPLMLLVVVTVVAGCGHGSEGLPTACIKGPEEIQAALASAPGPVRLDGAPISRCFNRDASGDDVEIVGTNLLSVAQALGDRARVNEEGDAALELGYLIGAARRGSGRNGLGAEIVRRLEQETGNLSARSAAYARGLRAGLAKG